MRVHKPCHTTNVTCRTYCTDTQIISTSSANMTVESFRLNLLPVWMTEIPFGGREHLVLINGQNGIVESDLPQKLPDWAVKVSF